MVQQGSTTVDRSVRLLFELAANPKGLTASELARRLGTQRPPLYRQLKTLLEARLIRRTDEKLYQLGVGVLELARSFSQPLAERAQPALQAVADDTGFSASFSVKEGPSLVIAVAASPRTAGLHLRAGIGFVFPPAQAVPLIATLAALPPEAEEDPAVTLTRTRGWTGSFSLPSQNGVVGVSVPAVLDGMAGSLNLIRGVGGSLDSAEAEHALAQRLLATKAQIMDYAGPSDMY